ncbi:MFS transporter [Thermophagus xiamenensis]|uniref:Major Facilitator Superfamily protein n=1 Tax=Thermophagus xiamenensis TaxID=385682 RepID=A0A1I1WY53_9BACT|nr:MFS transporter [Thermophagus xiamenensis]SFD98020.1 Major Facilitator Superfamily protein [Thermophagus xiamenensis]
MKRKIDYANLPFFYGYVVAFIGTIGIWASVPGQTIGVSTFTDPVKDALGLTRDQFSAAYMVGTFVSSLLLGKAGRWFDRWGARIVAVASALMLVSTLILSSFSDVLSAGLMTLTGFCHWIVPFSVMMVLFFMLRFSGQGVLTMSSRNMIMKWFDRYRGRVNAFVSISISLGFSSSPILFDWLIRKWEWSGAWRALAMVILVIAVFMWIFYRDNPEELGLVPDGKRGGKRGGGQKKRALKQFLPKEAFATRAFWSYALMLAFNSFFITGLSFHMVDIFTSAGFDRQDAVAVFLPISVVNLCVSLLFNFLSDIMALKKLLYVMLIGGFVWSIGLIGLSGGWGLWAVVAGAGICGGLFAVLNSVAWPKMFGRQHLGAISGRAMSMIVFASALAPFFFSLSKTFFNTYTSMGWLAMGFITFMFFSSLKAGNPQPEEKE